MNIRIKLGSNGPVGLDCLIDWWLLNIQ